MESALHFDEFDAMKIANAMQYIGCRECYAVLVEELNNAMQCSKVMAVTESLQEFSKSWSIFNCCLIDKDKRFLVLCSTEDYFLVIGPKAFVEFAVGSTVKIALERFREYTHSVQYSESELKYFEHVIRTVNEINGKGKAS